MPARLRDLGVPVELVPGWETRGRAYAREPRVIVCHHTAGPAAGDYPSLRVVRDGRPDVPGPLSQIGLGRSGVAYVIASGVSNNAGRGGYRGVTGNSNTIGIEAESTGRGDWTAAQRDAYPRVVAALCRGLATDASWVCGHREWTPRKIDPYGIDMGALRQRVTDLLRAPQVPAPPLEEDDDMARLVQDEQGFVWVVAGNTRTHVGHPANVEKLRAAGLAAPKAGDIPKVDRALLDDVFPVLGQPER